LSLIAISLLIFSACVHAGWNMLGKSRNPDMVTFFLANTIALPILLPGLIYFTRVLPHISPTVWAMVVLTGVFQALYFSSLAGAYRNGDLSLAYPLARSTPVVLVVILNILLGRGSQLSALYLAGAALVLVGIFLTPQKRFGGLHLSDYRNLACLLAVGAAFCTAGYSMVDDQALRILRAAPGLPVSGPEATLAYAFLEGVFSSLWLGVLVLVSPRNRAALRAQLQPEARGANLKHAALVGMGMYLAYTIVLVAMGFASNVSYIVTFRQLSIPLGALLGMTVLNEHAYPPRLVGVGFIFAGLVLVGLG
jgi:drug/metabolite transporter (DMT)-like permease